MRAVEGLLDSFYERAVLRIVDDHAGPRNRLETKPMTSDRATKCKRKNRSAKSPHKREATSSAVFMSTTRIGQRTAANCSDLQRGQRATTSRQTGFVKCFRYPQPRHFQPSALAICRPNVPAFQSADHREADRNPDRVAIMLELTDHHTSFLTDVAKSVLPDHSSQSALRFVRAWP
jgi:hypothetical protein